MAGLLDKSVQSLFVQFVSLLSSLCSPLSLALIALLSSALISLFCSHLSFAWSLLFALLILVWLFFPYCAFFHICIVRTIPSTYTPPRAKVKQRFFVRTGTPRPRLSSSCKHLDFDCDAYVCEREIAQHLESERVLVGVDDGGCRC